MVLVAFGFDSGSEVDADEDEGRRRRWGGDSFEESSREGLSSYGVI